MNILIVYKEDYPWDVRVEKIAITLAGAGHDVTILANNCEQKPSFERIGSYRVRRLYTLSRIRGPLGKVIGKALRLLFAPVFFNPIWLLHILSSIIRHKSDVVIVRDLPLVVSGIFTAKMLRRRVVFDMAECYPEMYSSIQTFNRPSLLNRIVKHPAIAAGIERFCVRRVDLTLVMIEESHTRLVRRYGETIPLEIVSNTPVLSGKPVRLHSTHTILKLLYVGFITRIRGLDNAILGIERYISRNSGSKPKIEFHVVGIGGALDEYRQLVNDRGLNEFVHFYGYSDQEFVDDLYAMCDFGVLTYHVCGHWNHTIPNKLFDYMYAGMPVLATNIVPIKRILEEVGCVIAIPARDHDACEDEI